jgi:sugar phosphate isomerase/epimerase
VTGTTALISMIQYHDALVAGTMTLPEVVAAARRLGAGGVEFRPDYWRDKGRDIAAVREVSAALGQRAILATFTPLFTEDEVLLRQEIDDAVALGSPLLRVFQGPAPSAADDPAWARAQRAVDYAAGRGLVLALENFMRAPGARVAEIGRVLDMIVSPALGTNVDIGNYALNDEDVPATIARFGDRVVMSHLKDMTAEGDATFLGAGTLPLPAILDAFDQLGQPIIHCFEFGGAADADGRIAASLAYLQARAAR